MKIKILFQWCKQKIINYNVFIPDENDYDEENDELKDPVIVLKHQRYATRLYFILFIVLLYILSLITLLSEPSQVVVISKITPLLFQQLQLAHGQTLSCPCSNTIVPYNIFVLNSVTYHSMCSSVFISQEWINALYNPRASSYLIMDFRTTAYSQFKFLADFCSLSQDTMAQTLADLGYIHLYSIQLLSENDVQSEVNKTIELALSNSYIKITQPLQFFQMITRANSLASALNTNVLITIRYLDSVYEISEVSTTYVDKYQYSDSLFTKSCDFINPVTPAGFYSTPFDEISHKHNLWPIYPPLFQPIATSRVHGFFGGCTALDAVLSSTLDCLYRTQCVQVFSDYFPNLTQMNLNWTNSVLTRSQNFIPLYKRLDNLLIENLSTVINYSNYFYECAPSVCTYTETGQTNFSKAISLLLSLCGGLTIILRLIAPLLINLSLKFKHRRRNTNMNCAHHIRKVCKWIRQLNLFKTVDDRTENTIRRQQVTTRLYLIFLSISIVVVVLFMSLNTRTITTLESKPSLTEYKQLQLVYPNTIKCPCLNSLNRFKAFISSYHTFHQVCSSDFIKDAWISMLATKESGRKVLDWHRSAAQRFRLLSSLCHLANKTIDVAVQRLAARSLVTPNLLTESDFNSQLNVTLSQFTQSVITEFNLLIDKVHLFTRVDQPFTKSTNAKVTPIFNIHNDGSKKPVQIALRFTSLPTFNSSSVQCFCVTDFECQSPMIIGFFHSVYVTDLFYTVPGAFQGCFTIDSVLLSTLECFYSNSNCLSTVLNYVNYSLTHSLHVSQSPWVNVVPLEYNATASRFTPQTPLSRIVKEIMIEEWSQTFSFESYYNACTPNYCRYSYEIKSHSFIEIIIKLVSTISGLTVALRFITKKLVKLIFRLFGPKIQQQQPQGNYSFDVSTFVQDNLTIDFIDDEDH